MDRHRSTISLPVSDSGKFATDFVCLRAAATATKLLRRKLQFADRLCKRASVRSDASLPNGFGVFRHLRVLKGESHAELVWKQQQFL